MMTLTQRVRRWKQYAAERERCRNELLFVVTLTDQQWEHLTDCDKFITERLALFPGITAKLVIQRTG